MAEPYVMPGNVDGPASPFAGRAAWTWYTGSAAWYLRALIEGVLGVEATLDGLRVQAALPDGWDEYHIQRSYRCVTYDIYVRRATSGERTGCTVDDKPWLGETLPILEPGTEHYVKFICR
jgi:cellobiose phosphorylase